ncbi:uncharacterized protein LOC144875443 [Branchiostoma floridae x Branchiostoma japonicum]
MKVIVFLITACFHVGVSSGSVEQSQYVGCVVSRNVTSGTDQHSSRCASSGKSLALVLQTTTSMEVDVDALKCALWKANSPTTECYVLVVFDDKGVTTLYNGEGLDGLPPLLEKLAYTASPVQRRACVITAIEEASRYLSPGSRVYIQTDSAPSDMEENGRILAVLQEKRIAVDVLLTRPSGEALGMNGKTDKTVSSWFTDLAELSGGIVLEGDKEDIDELTAVIGVSVSNSAPVSLFKAVVPAGIGREIPVFVDSFLLEFFVSVVGNNTAPSLITYTPQGTIHDPASDASSEIVVSVNRNLVYRVQNPQNPQPGTWRIHLTDSQAYNMDVSGKSSMDFSYQFVSERNGVLLPIEGRPMAGLNTTVIIQMTAEENLERLQQVVLFDRAGTEIIASPLQSRAGISGTKYSATILLSSQSFRIGVTGTDRNNFTLQRIDTAWIQPQYVSVETLPGTQGQLFPGGQLIVPVLIMNHGNLNVFRLNVSDDAGLVRGVEPAVVSLPFGENTTVLVTFAAPANSSIGSTSITNLLVSGDDGSFNSIVLRVSVEARSTDVPDFVPPSCIIQHISKNCTLEQQHLSVCGNYNWSVSVDVRDEVSGIFRLTTSPSDQGVLAYEDFPEGISKTAINVTYRSNCCHPSVTITVSDMDGNVGQCAVDFYISFPTTTTTTVAATTATAKPTTETTASAAIALTTTAKATTVATTTATIAATTTATTAETTTATTSAATTAATTKTIATTAASTAKVTTAATTTASTAKVTTAATTTAKATTAARATTATTSAANATTTATSTTTAEKATAATGKPIIASVSPQTEGQLMDMTPDTTINNDASDIAAIVVGSVLGSVVLILIILHAVVSFSVSWYRRRGQKKVAHAQYRVSVDVNEVDVSQIN